MELNNETTYLVDSDCKEFSRDVYAVRLCVTLRMLDSRELQRLSKRQPPPSNSLVIKSATQMDRFVASFLLSCNGLILHNLVIAYPQDSGRKRRAEGLVACSRKGFCKLKEFHVNQAI